MRLKDCFKEDFVGWLLRSNNPKVGPYLSEDRFKDMLVRVENESLVEILDILLREPLADYFWYGYPENGGKLSSHLNHIHSLPHHDTVPAGAIRVDRDKIKIFLRDYKITELLK